MSEQDLSPEALAKGDEPGAEAMDAAKQIAKGLAHKMRLGEGQVGKIAAIIQAAIDEATAASEASEMRLIQERNEARAERDRATEARLQYAELVSAARDERNEARAAARELGGFLNVIHTTFLSEDAFPDSRASIKAMLTKHAALLAEPEGGG